jgi:hypothetical protein
VKQKVQRFKVQRFRVQRRRWLKEFTRLRRAAS